MEATALVFLLVLGLVLLVAIWSSTRRESKQMTQLRQEWRELEAKHLQALDTAIEEWLVMLELPALEEQTKRQAAAHQLRIVLFEKLLLWRAPD